MTHPFIYTVTYVDGGNLKQTFDCGRSESQAMDAAQKFARQPFNSNVRVNVFYDPQETA